MNYIAFQVSKLVEICAAGLQWSASMLEAPPFLFLTSCRGAGKPGGADCFLSIWESEVSESKARLGSI